jgi:hypothetical protein
MGGHKFTKDYKGRPGGPGRASNPSSSGFGDLEKMLGQDLNNRFGGQGFGGPGGLGGPGSQGGMGGNQFGNPYHNIDPKALIGGNGGNPNGYGSVGNNQFVGGTQPYPQGGSTPPNLGPQFFVPGEVTSKHKEGTVRQSITSINDIDYYPEMEAKPALFGKDQVTDPDFDAICERLRKGM